MPASLLREEYRGEDCIGLHYGPTGCPVWTAGGLYLTIKLTVKYSREYRQNKTRRAAHSVSGWHNSTSPVDCLSSDMKKTNKRNPYHNFLLNTPEAEVNSVHSNFNNNSQTSPVFDVWSPLGPVSSCLRHLNWSSVLAGIRWLTTGRGQLQLRHEESYEETGQAWRGS